jgi:hypothetical protein
MKSAMSKVTMLALTIGGLTAGFGASAHHSFAMFDDGKRVIIEGTVHEFQWTQPHVWLDVMVTPAPGATPVRWGIESQSPAILFRRGWRPETIKAGEKVKVEVHPMKDGTPGGQMLKVTLPDGRVITTAMGERY